MVDIVVFITGLLAATIQLSIPLLFGALGETFGQRSGVFNFAVDGIMLLGAFTSFTITYFTLNLWLGVIIGLATGALMGLIIAFMEVTARTNQAVTGVMWGIVLFGLVAFLIRSIFGGSFIKARVRFESISIPVLSQIPVIGPILFNHNVLVYLAFLLVPIFGIILFRTSFGLKTIAVGDKPQAADSLGVNVHRIRYLCVILSGTMAGLGGAYVSLASSNVLTETVIAGRGWIVIALVIFGMWSPYKIFGGVLLFSFVRALQLWLQAIGVGIPSEFMAMIPYMLPIVALLFVSRKRSAKPESLAQPYIRE